MGRAERSHLAEAITPRALDGSIGSALGMFGVLAGERRALIISSGAGAALVRARPDSEAGPPSFWGGCAPPILRPGSSS